MLLIWVSTYVVNTHNWQNQRASCEPCITYKRTVSSCLWKVSICSFLTCNESMEVCMSIVSLSKMKHSSGLFRVSFFVTVGSRTSTSKSSCASMSNWEHPRGETFFKLFLSSLLLYGQKVLKKVDLKVGCSFWEPS